MTKDGKTAVIQQNIYNGEGQRIQKIDGDETINYYYQDGVVAYTTDTDGNQNSQNLIGTGENVLATERFQQNATQYYLYNKDIQGSTSSLVKEDGSADAIYQYTDLSRLRNEYLYLSHKFSLQPMDYKQWRFLRLRPQNFPQDRKSVV